METLQKIYGFRYDFMHRQGLVMKLHREGGIFTEELSDIQLRMLESNAIPRLLPLEVLEIDFQISLLYKLHAKRMLSQVIKAEGLSAVQLIKLVYAIICAMHDSGNYMLNETQYVLEENFIFIGSEITDVHLTYLPFKQLVGEIPIHLQLSALIERLSEKMNQDERASIEKLLEACTENFQLAAFKQMLLEQLGQAKGIKRVVKIHTVPVIEPVPQFAGNEVHSLVASSPAVVNKDVQPSLSFIPTPLYKKHTAADPITSFNLPPMAPTHDTHEDNSTFMLTQRNKLIVLISFIVILALIWKSYLDRKQDALLYISGGATILLIDIWFVLSYLGLPKSWSKFIVSQRNKADAQDYSRLMGNWSAQGASNHADLLSESKSQVNIQDYYQNLHQHTTLLSAAPSHATVFLGGSGAGISPIKARAAMIEVSKEGIKQHIPVEGNSFMIGRGETNADYADNEAGISRLHAEIYKAVEGYGVKDLGSKNGTYLNEEQLVPYQSYPIKQGDTIRIVRTEFRLIV